MKFKINVRSLWELGQREKQEDSLFPSHERCCEKDRVFIVCDGMGGHDAGDVASSMVCEAMGNFLIKNVPDSEGPFADDNFFQALSWAYDALDEHDNGAAKKMGTTLTFLKLHDNGCTIAHIGDSRVYHIRPGSTAEDTKILFQTIDHSLVNDLVKLGEMTPEEAKTSNQRNIITRAMQPGENNRCKADIHHIYDIESGDYFLMCTDGILEQMEDCNLQYIFSEKTGDIDNKKDMLKKVTSKNSDNHTAFIIHIEDVKGTAANHVIEDEIGKEQEEIEDHYISPIEDVNVNISNLEDSHNDNKNSFWNKWIQPTLIVGIILIAIYLLLDNFILNNKERNEDKKEQIDKPADTKPNRNSHTKPTVNKPAVTKPQPNKPSSPEPVSQEEVNTTETSVTEPVNTENTAPEKTDSQNTEQESAAPTATNTQQTESSDENDPNIVNSDSEVANSDSEVVNSDEQINKDRKK